MGPFDVIGDIHGALEALRALGRALGYAVEDDWTHAQGRRLVFIGDLVDRGPHSLEVAELVHDLARRGRALCLMGNHEYNLVEWRRRGRKREDVKRSNAPTVADIDARPARWEPMLDFFESLPLALELDDLRVTHAAWHRDCVEALAPALASPSPSHPVHPDFAPLVRLHSPYEEGQLRSNLPSEPLEILLKGHERDAAEPFVDNDGKTRDKVRAAWWREGHCEVPRDRRLVVGHYWNLPPVPGRHDAFVPPHPSGHPQLRTWLAAMRPHLSPRGRAEVPREVWAVCVDFNGVPKAGGPACVAAYRYPEAAVVWASGP